MTTNLWAGRAARRATATRRDREMTWDARRERLARDRLLARLLDLGTNAPHSCHPLYLSFHRNGVVAGVG